MKFSSPLLLITAVAALAGCATSAQSYAKQHPELTPAQVQILTTGKIPDGDAVAGMTREQVQLAMGVDPVQYTKVDGHDAWVYVQKKLMSSGMMAYSSELDQNDKRNKHKLSDEASQAPQSQPEVKTTVIFDGEKAVRASVENGGL